MPDSFISIENGIESPVNDMKELNRLIQFLFRSDTRQEWTTEKTIDNWVTFPLFDEESLIFNDEDNRRGLAGILEDTVTVILAGEDTDLTDDMIPDRLFSFSLIKTDHRGNSIDEAFTQDERDFIISRFLLSEYADLLALVCHRDEKDSFERLYGMFVWLPGKLNRIASVLEPEASSEEGPEEEPEEDSDNSSDEKSESELEMEQGSEKEEE